MLILTAWVIVYVLKTFITSSPRWFMTFTAMRPDLLTGICFSRARPLSSAARVRENSFLGSPAFGATLRERSPACQRAIFSGSYGLVSGVASGAGVASDREPGPAPEQPGIRAHPGRGASQEPLFCVRQDVFVIGHRVHIVTRFVGVSTQRCWGGEILAVGRARHPGGEVSAPPPAGRQ